MGKDRWYAGTVKGILTNEKYCGDALMQKTYTKDFREHRSVKNTELNKYFKENHHAAIIKKAHCQQVLEILSIRCTDERVTELRRLTSRFVVTRAKHPLFKGFFVLDPRWTAADRREFMKIIDEAQKIQDMKGE